MKNKLFQIQFQKSEPLLKSSCSSVLLRVFEEWMNGLLDDPPSLGSYDGQDGWLGENSKIQISGMQYKKNMKSKEQPLRA